MIIMSLLSTLLLVSLSSDCLLSVGSKAKLLALTREAMQLPDALKELDWTAPDPPATPAAGTPALMLPAAAAQGDSSPSAHKQAHAAGEDERMDRTGATLKVGDKVKLIAGIDSKLVALEAEVADLNLKGTAVWAPSRMQVGKYGDNREQHALLMLQQDT